MTAGAAEQVIAAMRHRFRAFRDGDWVALREIFHPDLLYIHSSGKREGADEFLRGIASGDFSYEDVEIEVGDVRIADRTAVVAARLRATFYGPLGVKRLDALFTDVWVESDGQWRLLAYHGSPPPETH